MFNVFAVRLCATATAAGKTIASRNKIVVRIRVLFSHRYSTFRQPARQPAARTCCDEWRLESPISSTFSLTSNRGLGIPTVVILQSATRARSPLSCAKIDPAVYTHLQND